MKRTVEWSAVLSSRRLSAEHGGYRRISPATSVPVGFGNRYCSAAWPRPPTAQSRAFDGCELRPTESARCYRLARSGKLLLTLHRHPEDEWLLFARNERGGSSA